MKNKRENIIDAIVASIVASIACIITFALGYFGGYYNNKDKKPDIPTPVEKEIIDTLYITRDSLIYRIKYLDSIKYDTIEKVYKLNDTSTLDLFYKLVSE